MQNHPKKKRIVHIAGIGAIGGLMANYFTHSHREVHLILKDDQRLAEYQASKLTVIQGDTVSVKHPKAFSLNHLENEHINFLLCCVKSYDIANLLMRLQSHLNEKSIIILNHNGLGVLDEIKQTLPHLRIIYGISTIGAYVEKPFIIRECPGGKIYLGIVAGHFTQHEINGIHRIYRTAKLPYQWEDNIQVKIWEKFSQNCSINLLTVLFACKNGGLLAHLDALEKLTSEVACVVSAYGIDMSAAGLYQTTTQLIKLTAENYSSMYEDVRNNRRTELNYLNVHLVELAQKKGISVPFNIELLKQFYKKFPKQPRSSKSDVLDDPLFWK